MEFYYATMIDAKFKVLGCGSAIREAIRNYLYKKAGV
jgi:hypothetical protein